jgi:predicted PurR-regulated permease PerM
MSETTAPAASDTASAGKPKTLTAQAIEVIVKVGLILALAAWSYDIIRPFIGPIVWAVIIAVAYYPFVLWLADRLGGRTTLAATLATLLGLTILIAPSLTLGVAAVEQGREVAAQIQEGTFDVPPPPDQAKEVPVVGERLHAFWKLAETNMDEAVKKAAPTLKPVASKAVGAGMGLVLGLLQFVFSLIVAGVLMAKAQDIRAGMIRLAARVSDKAKGERLLTASINTIRSVVKGILGIAVIQSIATGIGFSIAGVPMTGLWAAVVLVLAVVQLPPALVLLPASIHMYGELGGGWGTAFLVWNLIIILSENVLKPILFGRGVEAPMLVVFIGAIGGMLAAGIIGLFIGPVILSLFWMLFQDWLEQELPAPAAAVAPTAAGAVAAQPAEGAQAAAATPAAPSTPAMPAFGGSAPSEGEEGKGAG